MSKSCFTCKHHEFEKGWVDSPTCVDCLGKYGEKTGRKRYKYSHEVATRALGLDKIELDLPTE